MTRDEIEREARAWCDRRHIGAAIDLADAIETLTRIHAAGLAQGRAEGAEAMRERAAQWHHEREREDAAASRTCSAVGNHTAASVYAQKSTWHYAAASAIRALPTDTTAREAERSER